jgi:hypothetical protein
MVAGRLPEDRVRRLRSAAGRVSCMASGSPKAGASEVEPSAQQSAGHV